MEQGEKYTSKLGAYPCIYLTMKDLDEVNYEEMIERLKTAIKRAYSEHRYLLESEKMYEEDKEKIRNVLFKSESEAELKDSIIDLSEFL